MLAAITLLSGSCREDTIIRADAAPGIDGINVREMDTLTVLSESVFIDTLNTSKEYEGVPIVHTAGTVTDPYIGKTHAGIYLQVLPIANAFNFSSEPYTLDSAFVILPFSGFRWGDTSTADLHTFNVWEVTESLSSTEAYYCNQKKSVDPVPISEPYTFDAKELRTGDSTLVNGVKQPAHIRIRLKSSFVQRISTEAGKSNFDTKESFLNWFKGMYIAPADTNAVTKILPYFYLDITSGSGDYKRAAIEFYFHENSDPTAKTAFFNFVRNDCAHYNYISRNYSSQAKSILNSTNITDSVLILQNEPGAVIDLRIPYIKNVPAGIINKAQLVLTKLSTGDTQQVKYLSPPRLDIYRVNSDGTVSSILDLEGGDNTFVNGTAVTTDIGGGIMLTQYKLNIPREVQRAVLEKQNELHLRIKGYFAEVLPAAYSLVAAGGNHSKYKLQLKIVYSTPE